MIAHPLYCAGINDINKSLNKNKISTHLTEPKNNETSKIKIVSPIKSKPESTQNNFESVSKNKPVPPPHGLYKYETIKAGNASFVVKTPVPIKLSKIKQTVPKEKIAKPLRIGAVKAPVRISEEPDISKYSNFQPIELTLKEFPSDYMFPDNLSSDESDAVLLLKQMHKAIQDSVPEYLVNSMYIQITQKYPAYQYLSALARFYLEECRLIRSNGYVYTGTAYYEAYSQLYAMYSHEAGSKNKIYSFVLQNCEERKKQIEDNNSQIDKENQSIKDSLDPYFLAEAIRRIEEKEYIESPYASTVPNEMTFWAQYNSYLENYKKLIKNYLLTKNFSEAAKAMADYEKFYAESIKRFHTVKYYKYDQGDTLFTKKIEMFRNAEEHLDFIRQYIALVSYQGEVNPENELFKTEIQKYVKIMEAYKKAEGSETVSGERISDEKLNLYQTHAASSSMYDQNNYYKNEVKFTFSTFTRSEGLYQPSDEIPAPHDTLKLWFVTNGSAPMHAFFMQISVTSSTSRREKNALMEFKPDSMGPYYCSKFIPNETDSDPVEPPPTAVAIEPLPTVAAVRAPLKTNYIQKNLINNLRRGSNSKDNYIACFDAEMYTDMLFKIYNTNGYFTTNGELNQMGYAIDKDYSETINGQKIINSAKFPECAHQSTIDKYIITPPTENFLKAGGAELIVAQPGGATKLIKNQADWLIVDAHGSISVPTGGIAWPDSNGKNHRLHPVELINNGVSAYSEDLEVLILFTCQSLKWQFDKNSETHSRGWQRALPNGVILGYQSASHDQANYDIIFLINNAVSDHTQKFTQKELSDMWFLANALAYKLYLNNIKNNSFGGYYCARNAATIHDKLWIGPVLKSTDANDSDLVTTRGRCPFYFRKYKGIFDNAKNEYYQFVKFDEKNM